MNNCHLSAQCWVSKQLFLSPFFCRWSHIHLYTSGQVLALLHIPWPLPKSRWWDHAAISPVLCIGSLNMFPPSSGRIPFNEDPNPNPHSSGPSTPLKNQIYSFSPSKSYSRQSSSSDTDLSLTPKTGKVLPPTLFWFCLVLFKLAFHSILFSAFSFLFCGGHVRYHSNMEKGVLIVEKVWKPIYKCLWFSLYLKFCTLHFIAHRHPLLADTNCIKSKTVARNCLLISST